MQLWAVVVLGVGGETLQGLPLLQQPPGRGLPGGQVSASQKIPLELGPQSAEP